MSKRNKILKAEFRLPQSVTYSQPEIDGIQYIDLSQSDIWTDLDDIGSMLSMERLPNEDNTSFRERILKQSILSGNSSEEGFQFVANNELGFESKVIAQIECTNTSLEAPEIIVSPTKIQIYNRLVSEEDYSLATSLSFFHRDYTSLVALATAIDSLDNFSFTILDSSLSYVPSQWLISARMQKSSRETIPSGTIVHQFEYGNLIPGSVIVPFSSVLRLEVGSLADITKEGDYFIDYQEGVLVSYQPIASNSKVYYRYFENPLSVRISGCSIISTKNILEDPEFFVEDEPKDLLQNLIITSKNLSGQCWSE